MAGFYAEFRLPPVGVAGYDTTLAEFIRKLMWTFAHLMLGVAPYTTVAAKIAAEADTAHNICAAPS